MSDENYQILTGATFVKGTTIVMTHDGKRQRYKVLWLNGSTITIRKACWVDRLTDWAFYTKSVIYWKLFEWYDDILERLGVTFL